MSESCIFSIDLVSEKRCHPEMIPFIKSKIRELDFDREVIDSVCAILSINNDDRVEIYMEGSSFQEDSPEHFLDFISKLESIVGGFDSGSSFKWQVEFPFSSRTWIKDGYDWDLAHSEEDDYYDGDNWGDPEWDDWEN